jgi:hypothetical protein
MELYKNRLKNLKKRDLLEDLFVDRRVILNWMLKE